MDFYREFKMKISIITVCYQASKTIRRCIESVTSQVYADIEYIIIDGQSTDGTLEILGEYSNKISHWISEPDKGIYDAMNKGIRMASGDIIGFLNADDWFADQNAVNHIAEAFKENGVKCVYADVAMVLSEDTDRVFRYWKGKNLIA
jgi:glycosyltransferase involved in cell wall biosynthesis